MDSDRSGSGNDSDRLGSGNDNDSDQSGNKDSDSLDQSGNGNNNKVSDRFALQCMTSRCISNHCVFLYHQRMIKTII